MVTSTAWSEPPLSTNSVLPSVFTVSGSWTPASWLFVPDTSPPPPSSPASGLPVAGSGAPGAAGASSRPGKIGRGAVGGAAGTWRPAYSASWLHDAKAVSRFALRGLRASAGAEATASASSARRAAIRRGRIGRTLSARVVMRPANVANFTFGRLRNPGHAPMMWMEWVERDGSRRHSRR